MACWPSFRRARARYDASTSTDVSKLHPSSPPSAGSSSAGSSAASVASIPIRSSDPRPRQ